MSVNLIKGDTFFAVENSVFEHIKSHRDKKSPIALIVPDQFTQSVEKSLFKALDIKCSFDIDVVSFSRLANQYKHGNLPQLNQQTSVLLLSKVIANNANKFVCYNKVVGHGKFANQIYAVMTSIRNNNVTPDKLRAVAKKTDGYLAGKISDIALVLEEYNKELSYYTDISSLLENFREMIPDIADIKKTQFYVFGFHSMTPNKQAIVKALMQHAKSVTLGLVDISAHENSRISPADIRALENMALGYSAKVVCHATGCMAPEQKYVLNKLFGYNIANFEGKNNTYAIARTRNIEDEIKGVAQKIRALIIDGYRFKDIAVVCEDFNAYTYLINKIFSSYDISYFIDDKINIANMPQYKFLSAAVKFLSSNYDRMYLLEMLKSGAFDIDYNDVTAYENYVYKYNIDRKRLLTEYVLGEQAEREQAERVRLVFLSYIDQLLLASKKSCSDVLQALEYTFGRLKQMPTHRYAQLDDVSKIEAVDIAWTKLDETFEDIKIMLSDSYISAESAINLALDCLSSIEFSLAPIKSDCVFVGTPQDSRFESVKVMFLLGANSLSYPITASDTGIIRDADLELFAKYGLEIQPNNTERIRQSKFYITQLLVMAKEKVFISCPSLYDDMATIVLQLKTMFGLQVKDINPNICQSDSEQEIALKIGTYSNLQSIFCRNIGMQGMRDNSLNSFAKKHIDMQLIDNLYQTILPLYNASCDDVCFKDNYIKISAIERFFDCPFKFFVENGLKLLDRQMGKVEINELGSFVHRVLEIFYAQNREPIEDCQQLYNKVKAIVDSVLNESEFEHFKRQDTSGGYKKQLEERCCSIVESTNKMLTRSQFRPQYLEYKFGLGDNIPPIKIDVNGKTYKVRGVIDRVDVYQDKLVVIDYKSSEKEFDVKNIFAGHRLQLLIYLKAVLSKDKKCAGLYYLALPYKYTKDSQDDDINYNFKGFIASDIETINQQDKLATDNTFLPLKLKRGAQELDLSKENVLDQKQFEQLQQYAFKLVGKAVEAVSEGYIAPTHTTNACKYCKYGQLCKIKDREALQLKEVKAVWEKANE